MRKLKLKVCGMRDPKNILEVAVLQPDFMGFIFYPSSKRFVGKEFSIPKGLPDSVKRVGVFVDESISNVVSFSKQHSLDYAQLHGNENLDYCKTLSAKMKIIKVFHVDENFDFDLTKKFENVVEYFLFDTKSDSMGGSGKVFDWGLLRKYSGKVPFFLSGGLSFENISELNELDHSKLFAVDVNSKAESAPAIKNVSIIKSITKYLNS